MKTPPPPILVSFGTAQNLFEAVPERVRESHQTEIELLLAKNLPPVVSISVVSTLFGVSPNFIASILRAPHRYYRHFTIRKGRKKREIHAPKVSLKLIQNWIGSNISRAVIFPDYVLGFVPKKHGVIEAAQHHCEAHWVYSLDLRDFFTSIKADRLHKPLQELGYSENSVRLIARFCMFTDFLPQGSPASPVLSNLSFLDTDNAINELAASRGVRYTRYADDLVFSGTGEFPEEFDSAIKALIERHGWNIAKEKEHLAKLPARLKVHGLLVHHDTPRLTKGYRNKIRAYRHLLTAGRVSSEDLARIKGHISYADYLGRCNVPHDQDDTPK